MSEGFDLKVHHRDAKSGRIAKVTPYQLKVSKETGQTYIRGGVIFYPDGTVKYDPATEKKETKDKK